MRDTRGVVRTVSEKEWYDNRADENIFLYSFQLEGDKKWYRTGRVDPADHNIAEGSCIAFQFDPRSGEVVLDSVEEIEASEAERAPPARKAATSGRTGSYGKSSGGGKGSAPARSSAPRGGGGTSRDDYWKDKEARDIEREKRYQDVVEPRMIVMAAQERAVAAVAAALANDCLSFGNTTKGKKFDILLSMVDEATMHFVSQALDATNVVASVGDGPAPRSDEEETWDE